MAVLVFFLVKCAGAVLFKLKFYLLKKLCCDRLVSFFRLDIDLSRLTSLVNLFILLWPIRLCDYKYVILWPCTRVALQLAESLVCWHFWLKIGSPSYS